MKYELKTVGKKSVQVTTTDERWYIDTQKDGTTQFKPSVTWIASYYPKGIGFMKWLADKGWSEAEAIKTSAGDKGTKVHKAIESYLNGETIKHNSKFLNKTTEQDEELSVEEYEAVISFADWYKQANAEILRTEFVVFTEKYAGTVDMLCEINSQKYLIDLKTSQQVWPEHELQVSAYKYASKKPEEIKTAILQVGYRRNKRGWKFTEISDKMEVFEASYKIWDNEVSQKQPLQKDLPLSIKLK